MNTPSWPYMRVNPFYIWCLALSLSVFIWSIFFRYGSSTVFDILSESANSINGTLYYYWPLWNFNHFSFLKGISTLTWPRLLQYSECLSHAVGKPFKQFMQKWYASLWVPFKRLKQPSMFLIAVKYLFSPSIIIIKVTCLLHFSLCSDLQTVYIPFLLLNNKFTAIPGFFF